MLAIFLTLSICPLSWASEPELRIGIVADAQYAPIEAKDDMHYASSLKKLEDAVKSFNEDKVDFVIQLGDFIQEDQSSLEKMLAVWDKLEMPGYHVLGNHDYSIDDNLKKNLPAMLGMEKNYYSWSVNDWTFIVLDGNEISFHAYAREDPLYKDAAEYMKRLQNEGKLNGLPVNGAMSEDQINWLKDNLENACSANKKVILFSHYPTYPENRLNLWNDKQVLDVLRSKDCVQAFFTGHNHAGSYAVKDNIHHLTFQGMLMTEDENAYSILELYQDRMEVRGYGREENKTLFPETADHAAESEEASNEQKPSAKKVPPLYESPAFLKYRSGSGSELAKLVFIIDRFYEKGVSIIYDGNLYDSEFAMKTARNYLARQYRKEKAAKWIKRHAYRSLHAGDIILIQYPDGEQKVMRDEFLDELELLDKAA